LRHDFRPEDPFAVPQVSNLFDGRRSVSLTAIALRRDYKLRLGVIFKDKGQHLSIRCNRYSVNAHPFPSRLASLYRVCIDFLERQLVTRGRLLKGILPVEFSAIRSPFIVHTKPSPLAL